MLFYVPPSLVVSKLMQLCAAVAQRAIPPVGSTTGCHEHVSCILCRNEQPRTPWGKPPGSNRNQARTPPDLGKPAEKLPLEARRRSPPLLIGGTRLSGCHRAGLEMGVPEIRLRNIDKIWHARQPSLCCASRVREWAHVGGVMREARRSFRSYWPAKPGAPFPALPAAVGASGSLTAPVDRHAEDRTKGSFRYEACYRGRPCDARVFFGAG